MKVEWDDSLRTTEFAGDDGAPGARGRRKSSRPVSASEGASSRTPVDFRDVLDRVLV